MPPSRARTSAKKRAGGGAKKKKPTAMETGEPQAPLTPSVWRPGLDSLAEGEALDYDPTAYDCLHSLMLEWPCLSFDVLPDALGPHRTSFPHTLYLVAGTQAATRTANTLTLLRLGGLGQGRHGARAARRRARRGKAGDDGDGPSSSDSDWDSSDDSDAGEAPPTLHSRSVALNAGVNRVRAGPGAAGLSHLVAAWRDDGGVHVYDTAALRASLDAAPSAKPTNPKPAPSKPVGASGSAHTTEGFALGWSAVAPGRLASGDCAGGLRVWEPQGGASSSCPSSWLISSPLVGHAGSVEDVAWSPTEPTVLASAGVDRSIRVWDIRSPGSAGPQVTLPGAHASDVNVISWSGRATFMLASGGDDGAVKAWDLRAVAAAAASKSPSSGPPPGVVATLAAHRGPVTSVAWSPHEAAVLLSTGGDDATAVWDLALERDPDEEAALGAGGAVAPPADLPPQLLFLHAGQSQVKEGGWHPAIPGMVVTTAGDGFNVFKPANVGDNE